MPCTPPDTRQNQLPITNYQLPRLARPLIALALIAVTALSAACTHSSDAPSKNMTIPESQGMFEAAVALLQVEAKSPNPVIRANCMEALQNYRDHRTTDVLEQGLRDDAWVVRFAAALAVGKQKNADLQPNIASMVATDPDPSVRVAMVYALQRMGDSTNMNYLAHTLKAPDDPTLRANTALVLGMLGDPSAIPLLDTARHDHDPRVRLEVTTALARLGDPEAQQVILALSVTTSAEDIYTALSVAADLQNPDVNNVLLRGLHLRDQAKDASPQERVLLDRAALIAARGLGKRGDIQAGKLVLQFSRDPQPELRSLAALALGEMLYPSEEAPLARLLKDPDEHVKISAAAAIVQVQLRAIAAQTQPD